MKTLKSLGEWGFLRQILPPIRRFKKNRFLLPAGDDAAILKDGARTVLSIDGLVDGTHFRSTWQRMIEIKYGFSFPEALGWKLLTSALSDLAAMGPTRDRWAMIFLAGPGSLKKSFLLGLERGVLKAARRFDCVLAGGDTVRSQQLTLSAAVGGHLTGPHFLTRSGARPGDFLCVAGTLGDAYAGLRVLEGALRNLPSKDKQLFTRRFFYHQPLFPSSKILADFPGVTSLIDLSDSLAVSVRILCENSRTGARVFLEQVPVSKAFRRNFPAPPRPLGGGEDYALMFTVRKNRVKNLRDRLKFAVIGDIQPASQGLVFYEAGQRVPSIRSFEHF